MMKHDFKAPDPSIANDERDAWALAFAEIAMIAGEAILAIEKTMGVAGTKTDGSPVTEADQAAETIILDQLKKYAPWLPVVAEESHSAGHRIAPSHCFALVDPLDGTKEFIRRSGEYTVNIALVCNHRPVAGAIYAPALGEIWWGGMTGFYAKGKDPACLTKAVPIHCRTAPDQIDVLASRSHHSTMLDEFLKNHSVANCTFSGSSLKFCRIAEGKADLYPRFRPTMEWDTAAGHAILCASGGNLTHIDGSDFLYGLPETTWENPPFIAFGDPRLCPVNKNH
jgi:3'(2'), 5'-bisphosphate nucleotidase